MFCVSITGTSIITNSHFYPKKSFSYKTRRVVLPVGQTDSTGLGVETPSTIKMSAFGDIFERVNITSTANKVSGFAFSQYNTITFINHQILMSIDNFKEILDTIKKNVMATLTTVSGSSGYRTFCTQCSIWLFCVFRDYWK